MIREAQEKWNGLNEVCSIGASSWVRDDVESKASRVHARWDGILSASWQWARLQGYRKILAESYSGAEVCRIDEIQSGWECSLRASLPNLSGSRSFDVLLACREIVLNAMIHGCERRSDRISTLRMWTDSSSSWVRVRVADPGLGYHQGNVGTLGTSGVLRSNDSSGSSLDPHYGLVLAKRLATCFTTRSRGAQVQMDFDLAIDGEEDQRAL